MNRNNLLASVAGVGLAVWSYRKYQETLFSFRGKNVVLTGGSRGLGLVMARELIAEGARVAVLARDPETLAQARREFPAGTFFPVSCDVTQASDIEYALHEVRSHFRHVDVLIHNAGVIQVGPFENLSADDYKASLNLHFWAPFHLIRGFMPMMRASRAARVLLVNSIGGRMGVPHLSSYSAGKFAQSGFAESIRAELAAKNIKLTVAYPSLMRTGSTEHAHFRGNLMDERFWFTLLDSLPLISIPATQAVRTILNAVRAGRPEVIPGMVGVLGLKTWQLSPSLYGVLMRATNKLLPQPVVGAAAREGKQGFELPPDPRLKDVAILSHSAALANNEV